MAAPSSGPLAAGHFLFTSEAVTEGNPDKLCDKVSDAVLDACVAQDAESRILCDSVTKAGMVMVLGQVVSKGNVNFEQVVREAVRSVGYDADDKGLDWRTMSVIIALDDKGPDITAAIAGSQNPGVDDASCGGMVVASGYATDEAPDCMPLSHSLARKMCAQMDKLRKDASLPWLYPDARAQVTFEYQETSDGGVVPVKAHTVSILCSHSSDIQSEQAEQELMKQVVKTQIPENYLDSATRYQIVARPQRTGFSDSGLSGRKSDVDAYGGWSSSGSKLSGRDGNSLSRSAAYVARWAARSLVAARFCKRCTVQISFAPRAAEPAICVNTFGSGQSSSGKNDAELADIVLRNFDFTANGLKHDLGLSSLSQFQRLSTYGHYGRSELDLPWEKPKALK
eukprot:TRINITY_DN30952_c0_g1_i2.p1 TRINITY_DN30952_c0_g1~~TRINITY_DN30952_c0_g1_i2.p1  ORF type:complete len:396 (-),score=71.26 TRINITY_DN30952_c0_g1_i2:59-1246(-)